MNLIQKLKNKFSSLDEDLGEIIIKSASALFFKSGGYVFGYVVALLIARNLGAGAMGYFSLSISFLMIGTIIPKFGFDTYFIKSFSAGAYKDKYTLAIKELKFFYPLIIGVSILFSVLLFQFSGLIASTVFKLPELELSLKITSISAPFWVGVIINSSILRGLKLTNAYSFYFQAGRHVITALFLVSIFILGVGSKKFSGWAETAVLFHGISCFILFLLSSIHLIPIIKKICINQEKELNPIKRKQITNAFNTALPMMLASSLTFLLGWSDTILLGIFSTEEEVGVYNVALKVATISTFTLGAVNAIAAPKFSEIFHSGDLQRFKKSVLNTTKIIFWITVPICLLIIIFSDFIMGLFGTTFENHSLILIILTIGYMVSALSGSVGFILQLTGYQKVFQNIVFLAVLISLISNSILIPLYGAIGAAISTAVATCFWNIASIYKIYIKFGFLTLHNPF